MGIQVAWCSLKPDSIPVKRSKFISSSTKPRWFWRLRPVAELADESGAKLWDIQFGQPFFSRKMSGTDLSLSGDGGFPFHVATPSQKIHQLLGFSMKYPALGGHPETTTILAAAMHPSHSPARELHPHIAANPRPTKSCQSSYSWPTTRWLGRSWLISSIRQFGRSWSLILVATWGYRKNVETWKRPKGFLHGDAIGPRRSLHWNQQW